VEKLIICERSSECDEINYCSHREPHLKKTLCKDWKCKGIMCRCVPVGITIEIKLDDELFGEL
jgi:hypothetical protein